MIKTFLSLFFLTAFSLQAQIAKHYSNEFLNIGVDARALGMGNSVISNTSDATAGYWNPSLLYKAQNKQVVLMHSAYFSNIAQYDYLAYGDKINEKTGFSISLIRFGVDNIMNTTQLIDNQGNINYDKIIYFSAADYALSFSLGRKNLWKGFDAGVTAKIIYRHIGKFASGFGFGFDIGAAYHTKKWNFGLVARDITTTFNYWNIDKNQLQTIKDAVPNANDEIPNSIELTLPKVQLGINRNFHLKEHLDLSTEFDINTRFYQTFALINSKQISIDPSLGFEFQYYKIAFIRLGVNNFQKQKYFDEKQVTFQPNAGLGFEYKGISIDYALTNIGSNGFFSHIFSLKINLDKFFNKTQPK